MPPEPPPLWKKVFDAAEKLAAPRLEAAVRTERFADTTSALTKLQLRARESANQRSQQAMHNWNMPTATDVSRLREQVTSLERTVRELSKQIDGLQRTLALQTTVADTSARPRKAVQAKTATQHPKPTNGTNRNGSRAQSGRSRPARQT